MSEEWKQEKPGWCPHPECIFKRRVMDNICGGALPQPEPHDGDTNLYRICIRMDDKMPIFDLQVNDSDLEWFRWIFDALDGKVSCWLSKKQMNKTHARFI